MAKPLVTDDPQVLAALVRGMGGTPVAAETFRFDLPLEKVREVVPRLNDLGLSVFKVSERVTNHPTKCGCVQTVATLGLRRPSNESFRLPEWCPMLLKFECLIGTVTLTGAVSGKRYEWQVTVSAPGGITRTDETVERHWAPLLDEMLTATHDAVLRQISGAHRGGVMNVSELYDPDFWKRFFESIPAGSDRKDEMVAEVAANAGVSHAFARERVDDYLAGRLPKPQPSEFLIDPFAPSVYVQRGNDTLH